MLCLWVGSTHLPLIIIIIIKLASQQLIARLCICKVGYLESINVSEENSPSLENKPKPIIFNLESKTQYTILMHKKLNCVLLWSALNSRYIQVVAETHFINIFSSFLFEIENFIWWQESADPFHYCDLYDFTFTHLIYLLQLFNYHSFCTLKSQD